MLHSRTFDSFLEPWLCVRVPRMAEYSRQLAEFYDWTSTDVDAQANYTDRYAPPALETYDQAGEVVNRIVLNRWYDQQHTEVYRRGIIGLPYLEKAPHLLTFAMGYPAVAVGHQPALPGHAHRSRGLCTREPCSR